MQSTLLHQRYALACSVLEKPQSQTLTLAMLDEEQNFDPLDARISKLAGPHCQSIAFYDDNRKHGCRALEYEVRTAVYNGYVDRDESGRYPDTGDVREIIWVPVHDEMTIEQIAQAVVREVQGIDCNVFA
ncbi:hypothetical protein [Spirosoma sp. KNUC1025]|uniref:hypothetical protein n=1 Tax=Spirosoma sp. KNUC1025 TaxID=2894082 RepID=UPI003864C832|nr:hypothetical protein LN737_19055 [Spirosoma sp. KNUC1025]